jgi:hypothetical protein
MDRKLRGGKIGRKVVLLGERSESIEADFPAHFGVGWSSATNDDGLSIAGQRSRLRSHNFSSETQCAILGMRPIRVNVAIVTINESKAPFTHPHRRSSAQA